MTPTEIDYLSKAAKIGIILALGFLLVLFLHLVLHRLEVHTKSISRERERLARLNTLFQVGRSFGHVVIFIVIFFDYLIKCIDGL